MTHKEPIAIQSEEKVKRLGRKKRVGDVFESTSKRMNKYRWGKCRVVGEKVYCHKDMEGGLKCVSCCEDCAPRPITTSNQSK